MHYVVSQHGACDRACSGLCSSTCAGNELVLLRGVQVWDWLAGLTPEERAWVYTPKAACAGGIIEGLKAIIVDKLAAHHDKQRKAALQRPVSPAGPPKALMG